MNQRVNSLLLAFFALTAQAQLPTIEKALHQESDKPFFYAVAVPDGNYKVTVTLGSAKTFPGQTKELADDTHFNPYGAYEVSKMVVMGMKQIGCSLTEHLLPDWKDFDPAHPDSFDSFQWPASPTVDTSQPAGN